MVVLFLSQFHSKRSPLFENGPELGLQEATLFAFILATSAFQSVSPQPKTTTECLLEQIFLIQEDDKPI